MLSRHIITIVVCLVLATNQSLLSEPCLLCHQIVKSIQKYTPATPIELLLESIALPYCAKKLYPKEVCKGSIKQMIGIIIPAFWQHHTDPHAICPKLRLCKKEYQKRILKDDIAKIMNGKVEKEWETPKARKTIKIMHISDPHIDLFYTEGAQSNCSLPICCRTNSNSNLTMQQIIADHNKGKHLSTSEPSKVPAGYWGSLNTCDLPLQTFQLFLRQIKDQQIDLIYWTGDNPPHDIWRQSQSYIFNHTIILSQKIRQYTKVKVIPSMGNHQSYPVNVYDYNGERQTTLRSAMAQNWKPWLDQQAYQMLKKNGFFSYEIPELNNLKVISLNTQAQNNLNFYLLRDSTDPGNMLSWLQNQLRQSEKKGQFVHIIGHIPPRDFVYEWAERFAALVDRYSYTIRGQYYGHSHKDRACIFFSSTNSSKIVNYCLLAPSLACGKNPQYRIMTVDYDTLQLLDYEQNMLDLRKYSKKEQPASFEYQYSFKDAYKLKDMTLEGGMAEFNSKMKTNEETQKKYSFLQSSELSPGKSGRQVYCGLMISGRTYSECMGTAFKLSAFERLIGDWKDLKHHQ